MINRREALLLASAGFLVPTLSIAAQGTPVASPLATPAATPQASQPTRGSWLMPGGNPARTGVMPGPIPSLEHPIIVRWRYEPEDGWLNEREPVVANGIIYAQTSDSVHAINADTGLEFWRHEIRNSSFLTIDSGVLYAATLDGTLHAIAAGSGLPMWIYGEAPGAGTPSPYESELYATAVVDGVVTIIGNDAIHAVDAATGEARWQFPLPEALELHVVAEGMVFGTDGVGDFALDLQTGDQLWRSNSTVGAKAVSGNILLSTSWEFISGLDIHTGQELWRYTTPQERVRSLGVNGTQAFIIIATLNESGYYDGEVQAIDIETGGLVWIYSLGEFSDYPYIEMRIVRNQMFIKMDEPNNLLLVLDTTTGLNTWEYRGYITDVSPVAVDRNLYFVHDSELWAIGNLLEPALISDVTLRAAPAESGLERGTASAGDTINSLGARSDNNGELWVEISVGGVTGWVPASAIDPATLPPEGEIQVIFDPDWF